MLYRCLEIFVGVACIMSHTHILYFNCITHSNEDQYNIDFAILLFSEAKFVYVGQNLCSAPMADNVNVCVNNEVSNCHL